MNAEAVGQTRGVISTVDSFVHTEKDTAVQKNTHPRIMPTIRPA